MWDGSCSGQRFAVPQLNAIAGISTPCVTTVHYARISCYAVCVITDKLADWFGSEFVVCQKYRRQGAQVDLCSISSTAHTDRGLAIYLKRQSCNCSVQVPDDVLAALSATIAQLSVSSILATKSDRLVLSRSMCESGWFIA